jgi:hypothetical protein
MQLLRSATRVLLLLKSEIYYRYFLQYADIEKKSKVLFEFQSVTKAITIPFPELSTISVKKVRQYCSNVYFFPKNLDFINLAIMFAVRKNTTYFSCPTLKKPFPSKN